jgi:hypothetical protein
MRNLITTSHAASANPSFQCRSEITAAYAALFLIGLAFIPEPPHRFAMGLPAQPVTLSPQEVAALDQRLADARHNINNHLALVVASLELLRRRPEAMDRVLDNLSRQPQRIVDDLRDFTQSFEATMQITRD